MMLMNADLIISPQVDNIHWAEFYRHAELIELGYLAAEAAFDRLRQSPPRESRDKLHWLRRMLEWATDSDY